MYLYEFFVPISIQCGDRKIDRCTFSSLKKDSKHAVITGTGGSGKSILLKHFLLNALHDQEEVPIFVELRSINDNPRKLVDLLIETVREFELDVTDSYFNKALRHGHFAILLDGLDEVVSEHRGKFIKDIEKFTIKYPRCPVIVTTRPDQRLSELSVFSEYQALPLNLEQCLDLVEKLPADDEIKSKFSKDLEEGLYAQHTSFLSNPLLLSIMLLTYGYSADIPSKLSIFYNQAYEALYQRHDALKGAFSREKDSNLDIQEFSSAFSAFCIRTYDERRFQFPRSLCIEYLVEASEVSQIQFDPDAFCNDLMQCVCLLQEDGLFLTFAHRSFQEYFAARFILKSDPDTRLKFLQRYQPYITDDSVFKLLYEMDSSTLEVDLLLLFIDELLDKIGFRNKVGITHYYKFTKLMWSEVQFVNGGIRAVVKDIKSNATVEFIVRQVGNAFEVDTPKNDGVMGPLLSKDLEASRQGSSVTYHISDLGLRSDILRELYEYNSFIGHSRLLRLVTIRDAMREKNLDAQDSLERLFFSRKP